MKLLVFLILCTTSSFIIPAYAQPEPGDYYQEYIWTTPGKKKNSTFFRVGGRFDYRLQPENYPDLPLNGEEIPLFLDFNLMNAIKSEVTVEKVLCHDGTRNLSIQVNGKGRHIFPESPYIPVPQEQYMHHFYPTLKFPLSDLNQGKNNHIILEVDTAHSWGWPQNLIYGLIFRIYYPVPGSLNKMKLEARTVDEKTIQLFLDCDNKNEIRSVEFLANYDGPDWDGDGLYKDWHYHYHRGEIMNHVGTCTEIPFKMNWDVSWIPDQKELMQFSARVNYKDGNTYFIPEIDFKLTRKTYSVELCKPVSQPQRWLTRQGEHQSEFIVSTDLKQIKEAKMMFTSWSPGYLNGIYINDFLVFIKEGPNYEFMQHQIDIENLQSFKAGLNILKTGKTPLYHGNMVHGTEIMWPGIMILIKSSDKKSE